MGTSFAKFIRDSGQRKQAGHITVLTKMTAIVAKTSCIAGAIYPHKLSKPCAVSPLRRRSPEWTNPHFENNKGESMVVFLGYDLGGKAKNGVAAIRLSSDAPEVVETATVRDASEALSWLAAQAQHIY